HSWMLDNVIPPRRKEQEPVCPKGYQGLSGRVKGTEPPQGTGTQFSSFSFFFSSLYFLLPTSENRFSSAALVNRSGDKELYLQKLKKTCALRRPLWSVVICSGVRTPSIN